MSNTTYPATIDTPTNPSTNSTLATVPHHLQHGLENDAIVALETKLGTGTLLQTPTTNGFLVGTGTGASQWQPSPTSPSFTTSILDTNGKTWIGQTPAGASAVNYLNIANANTGSAPVLSALGTDNNINLNLVPKGSGSVQDNGSNLIDFRSSFSNFVKSGGVWSIQSGLAGNMTAMTLFIAGVEYSQALVTGHTFAASSDTYVDYTAGTGLAFNAVANNAASPALAANSVRIAIIVTSGAAITSINQGAPNVTAPVASSITYSVTDSLGNMIYPTNPSGGIVGYRQITSNFTTTSSSAVQVPGLSAPTIVPTGRKLKLTAFTFALATASTTGYLTMEIWDGVVGSGTQISQVTNYISTGGSNIGGIAQAIYQPSAGLHTFNVGFLCSQAATSSVSASPSAPAFVMAELI
jgi:hypothetical protein